MRIALKNCLDFFLCVLLLKLALWREKKASSLWILFMGTCFPSGLMVSRVFTPPTLLQVQLRQVCAIIHCCIEVFQQSWACPNNSLSKDYSLFSLESPFVFLFCPYIHDSIYPSFVMSAPSLSVFRAVHSRSWWLIKLSWPSSFYGIPFFMSWEAFQ